MHKTAYPQVVCEMMANRSDRRSPNLPASKTIIGRRNEYGENARTIHATRRLLPIVLQIFEDDLVRDGFDRVRAAIGMIGRCDEEHQ